jgi:lipoprotein-anchoring transpeptidase ErfK/SrfK
VRSHAILGAVAFVVLPCACDRSPKADATDASTPEAALVSGGDPPMAPPAADAPRIGVIAMQVYVHERPTASSRRLGDLRLGAKVVREGSPAGADGCAGGWYRVYPRGYVCNGENTTLDMAHPILRAAFARPDLAKPLPYKYGFVRAVSPLYLKVPNRKEQVSAEFGLDLHLEWWRSDEGRASNEVVLGANDVPIDARGVVVPGAAIGSQGKKSTDMPQGELFGGTGDNDPPPFWLTPPNYDRALPNVASYQVPPKSVFANRVRRHSGVSFVGSFPTGDDAFNRRFAVTTDLRLVPTSKVKPETASTWHGVEIDDATPIPFGWVRNSIKSVPVYRMNGSRPHKTDDKVERRALVRFSGNVQKTKDGLFRETSDGKWFKATDLGVVMAPAEWPPIAATGEKWIEVSIENQTLVLWEGKKPVFATLVSTGQDGMEHWKTSKATIRGTFRIRHKHVTATMDSTGASAEGSNEGSSAPVAEREVSSKDGAKDDGKAKKGAGAFELRDVPWVQYFEDSYALHAAYWHDVFGVARSHGCINLAPVDAYRVFGWTDPPIPRDWHGVRARSDTSEGTTIVIHR